MEAISQAGSCVGVLAKDGVVLAAEKRITSKARRRRLVLLLLPAACLLAAVAQTNTGAAAAGAGSTLASSAAACKHSDLLASQAILPMTAAPAPAAMPSRPLQLLDTQAVGVRREKMYRLDDHIGGRTARGSRRSCPGAQGSGTAAARRQRGRSAAAAAGGRHAARPAECNSGPHPGQRWGGPRHAKTPG